MITFTNSVFMANITAFPTLAGLHFLITPYNPLFASKSYAMGKFKITDRFTFCNDVAKMKIY